MYAFAVESYGKYGCIVPTGAGYIHKLKNKTRRGWLSETRRMRERPNTEVFVLDDYTEEMKHMSERQLAEYVLANYTSILSVEVRE